MYVSSEGAILSIRPRRAPNSTVAETEPAPDSWNSQLFPTNNTTDMTR